jgi:hypothetical protein
MMNVLPSFVLPALRSLAQGVRFFRLRSVLERLGWDEDSPEPLALPQDQAVSPVRRAQLRRSPVLILPEGWPQGTQVKRSPDYTWRFRLLQDERPDDQRPPAVRPEPLEIAKPITLEHYRQVARRHAHTLDQLNHTRGVLYTNNLGLVRFERENGVLRGVHELYTAHPKGLPPDKAFLAVLHKAPLDTPGETPPVLSTGD